MSKTPKGNKNIFDFQPGILNHFRPSPLAKRMGSPQSGNPPSIFAMSRIAGEATFKQEADLNLVFPCKAVVLKVFPNAGHSPISYNDVLHREKPNNIAVIKARIPEIHSMISCPDPINDKENFERLVGMHSTFISINEDLPTPKPGDIIRVDFNDRANRTGGVILDVLTTTQHTIPMANPVIKPECRPASPAPVGNSLQNTPDNITPVGEAGPLARARKSGAKAMIFGDSQSKGAPGKVIATYIESLGYSIIDAMAAQNIKGFRSVVTQKDIDRAKEKGKPPPETGRHKFAVHPTGKRSLKRYRVFGRSGASPKDYAKEGGTFSNPRKGLLQFLKPMFKKKPELVVIMLGGNGTRQGDATALVNAVRKHAPGCNIIWFGPPAAVPVTGKAPTGQSAWWPKRYPTFKKGAGGAHKPSESYFNLRRSYAQFISQELATIPNTRFIDVVPLMPNYNKKGCADGVHVNKAGAQELLENLKKQASDPPGGPIFTNNNMKVAVGQSADAYLNKSASPAPPKLSAIEEMIKESETQFTTPEKAKKFLDYVGNKVEMSIDELQDRDFISGIANIEAAGNDWDPLTYEELTAIHGFLIGPEDLQENFPTPSEKEDFEKLKHMSTKVAAAVSKYTASQEGEQEEPLSALSKGNPCPSPPEIEMGSNLPSGNPDSLNLGELPSDFIMGPLTLEKKFEIMKILSNKLGIHWGVALAVMQAETGAFFDERGSGDNRKIINKPSIGDKCKARIEPHVFVGAGNRKARATQAWLNKNPWAKQCKDFTCQIWSKKIGNSWKALRKLKKAKAAPDNHSLYRCATYGYAQVFPLAPGPAGLAPAGLGPFPKDAYQYSKLMRESEDAQIRAFFAFLILTKNGALIEACKKYDFAAIAKGYNNARYPYGWYIENYWKGRPRTYGLTFIYNKESDKSPKIQRKYNYLLKHYSKEKVEAKLAKYANTLMTRSEYKAKYGASNLKGGRYQRTAKGLKAGVFTGIGNLDEHNPPIS
jgi:lysophospholipase L1-like esterase